MAAASPMAGAPRTCSSRIAVQISPCVLRWRYSARFGSFVWSMMTRAGSSSSRATVSMARIFVFIVCLFSYNGCALVAASGRPADLSKKQAPRAQLIGKQVVCENDPRTRATAKCDWLSLTAPRRDGGG